MLSKHASMLLRDKNNWCYQHVYIKFVIVHDVAVVRDLDLCVSLTALNPGGAEKKWNNFSGEAEIIPKTATPISFISILIYGISCSYTCSSLAPD